MGTPGRRTPLLLPAYEPDAFTEASGQPTEPRRKAGAEYVSTSTGEPAAKRFWKDHLQVVLHLAANGRSYSLRGSFGAFVTYLDDGETVVAEYPPLRLAGYGRSEEETMEMFADAFDAMYQRLVGDPKAKLGRYARELRQRLSNLVVSVGED